MSVWDQLVRNLDEESTSDLLVNCGLCRQGYRLTLIGDRNWWEQNFLLSDSVMATTKERFHEFKPSLEEVMHSMVGLTRMSDIDYNVYFKLSRGISIARGCFSCQWADKMLATMSVARLC